MESLDLVPISPAGSLRTPAHAAAPESSTRRVSSHHVCQFYESDEYLCGAVARFLVEGMRNGQRVLLVATELHREGVARRMAELGVPFEAAVADGRLSAQDARATLALFMDGAKPDRARFFNALSGILDRIGAGSDAPIRIFGEMVDVLWREGNPTGALRLEELWNELAESRPFELLCGYSMGNFYRAADAGAFEEVCAQHARAIPTEVFSLTSDEAAREREIALLQQRARALEAELHHRRELEIALRQALRDRSRAEEALLEAKDQAEAAVRAKSDFLALMSHELRTPLNAILGYQDLLEHGVGGQINAEQRAYVSRMRACSLQLTRLIDQVLSLSRVEAVSLELNPELVDAGALARETASLVEPGAQRRGLFLDVTGPEEEITLVTDVVSLRQILLNLIVNAIKFTDAGGVTIEVGRTDRHVFFRVTDTGLGIRPQDLERIFEPFVQVASLARRRHGGSGLGLAVSRDTARALGGDLTVRSEPERGSVFTLTLPFTTPAGA